MYPVCRNTKPMRTTTNITYVHKYLFFVWIWIVRKYFRNCILRICCAHLLGRLVDEYFSFFVFCVSFVCVTFWRLLNCWLAEVLNTESFCNQWNFCWRLHFGVKWILVHPYRTAVISKHFGAVTSGGGHLRNRKKYSHGWRCFLIILFQKIICS